MISDIEEFSSKKIVLVLVLLIGIRGNFLVAQNDTTLIDDIQGITISAGRIEVNESKVPIAISTYKADAIQSISQQLSLQEYISDVPGLFSLNANNHAQDLRISIRGFGARAAFGIRGS